MLGFSSFQDEMVSGISISIRLMKSRLTYVCPYVVFAIVLFLGSIKYASGQVLPPPPTITSQPTSPFNVCRGTTGILNVGASGFALTYQWYITGPPGCEFCSTPLTNGGAYSGVNTASLSISTGALAAGTYYYICGVSNAGGSAWTNTIQVNVLASPTTTPGVTGASSCVAAALTLSASGANPLTGQSYRWFTALTGPAIAGQTGSTYTTPTLSTTTTYYVAIAGSNGCTGPRAAVTASINTAPTPSVTNGSSCGPGPVVLTASGGSAGQYRWYASSTGPVIPGETASTYTTTSLATSTTYYVSINNGSCESPRVAVQAIINTVPSAPSTTGSSSCGNAALTLNASGGSTGQYRWYTVSSGGSPIAGQTSSSYTTPTLTTSTTYYVSVNDGTCESTRTSVAATINTIPTAPSATGGAACGSAAVTLGASGGTAGQYRWYTVSSGGSPIAGQTSNSYTTPTLTTSTTYYVSINNGTCESTRTPTVATINTLPSAPTTTGSSSCGSAALTLTASGGSAGQYRWYTVSSGGSPIAAQTSNTYTTPTLTSSTTYYVSVNDGTCESIRTAVVAQINTIPSAPAATGSSVCGTSSLTLTASGGSAGQYRWYTTASGGTFIAGETSSSFTTPTLASTTTYYVAVNNGSCESSRTSVAAQIQTIPAAPVTTGNSACGPAQLTLAATGGASGQYRWYTTSTGGTAIAGETASTFTTAQLVSTTTYYAAINNGTCESSRSPVQALINAIPAAPTTMGGSGCDQPITLSATGGNDGQFRWYSSAAGGTPIAGQTGNTYAVSITATTTFFVSIHDGTCESARTAVTATLSSQCNEPPVIARVEEATPIGSELSVDLSSVISDPNDNLDLSTLTIVKQPKSGARATIENAVLIINYKGISFSGTDELTISVCDFANACTEQALYIEVMGGVNVYNAISPNGDGLNDILIIENIESLPETRNNVVIIFNRWGDELVRINNYNNTTNVFDGTSSDGKKLTPGTYFYRINFASGSSRSGYFVMR